MVKPWKNEKCMRARWSQYFAKKLRYSTVKFAFQGIIIHFLCLSISRHHINANNCLCCMQGCLKTTKKSHFSNTLFSNTVLSSFWAFATLLVIMRWAHILKENMMIRLALLLVGGMSLAIATNAPDALFSAVPIVWVWNFSPKLQPWHLLELEKRRKQKSTFQVI